MGEACPNILTRRGLRTTGRLADGPVGKVRNKAQHDGRPLLGWQISDPGPQGLIDQYRLRLLPRFRKVGERDVGSLPPAMTIDGFAGGDGEKTALQVGRVEQLRVTPPARPPPPLPPRRASVYGSPLRDRFPRSRERLAAN